MLKHHQTQVSGATPEGFVPLHASLCLLPGHEKSLQNANTHLTDRKTIFTSFQVLKTVNSEEDNASRQSEATTLGMEILLLVQPVTRVLMEMF